MENIEITGTALTDRMERITINKISWSYLPHDLLIYICKYLRRDDLQHLCLLCKHWRNSTHFKFIQKSKLNITPYNVARLRQSIQKDDEYESVEIHDIATSDELQPILKSLGPKILTLCLNRCPIVAILNDSCLPNLTELCIKHIRNVKSDDFVSFNLNKFKNLKAVDIKSFCLPSFVKEQIIYKLSYHKTFKLEKLCVDILLEHQDDLIYVLQVHGKSLKYLEMNIRRYTQNLPDWKFAFETMKHLEVLKFTGMVTKTFLKGILNALPENTPLRYISLTKILKYNLIQLVNNKWPGLVQNMEFTFCNEINNDHIKNLSILRHNLPKLVVNSSKIISVQGLLEGIAPETNNVLRTLVYENPRHFENKVLDMQLLIQRLPNLTNLSLKKNYDCVDDTVLSCIFRHLLHLQHLNLNRCSKITDNGLLGFGSNPAPITNLKGLQSLSLSRCKKITDKSLIECFKFIELRKLTCSKCSDISSEGIKELVKNCPALEELTLSGCSLIDDDSILAIAKGLHRLKRLNVEFCERLTIKCIDYILEFSRSLRDLSMQGQSDMDYEKAFEKLIRYGINLIQNTDAPSQQNFS